LALNTCLATTRLPFDQAELQRIGQLFDWSTLVLIHSTRHAWLVVGLSLLLQTLQLRAWRAGNSAAWFEVVCWSVVNVLFHSCLLAAGLTAIISLSNPH
jgi:hypothetical protein